MQSKDFIIVGSGLAACIVAHQLHQEGKSFTIISNPQLSSSSRVAAGICNPVVFFRITKSYMVDLALPYAAGFYRDIESKLGIACWSDMPLVKLFADAREMELWEKRREEGVGSYLGETLGPIAGIHATVGGGMVRKSARMDGAAFLDATAAFFTSDFQNQTFEYDRLKIEATGVIYNNAIQASGIIFCEGHCVVNNPWFGNVAMKPVKGDVLTVRFAEALPVSVRDFIVTRSCFLMPLGELTYKAGATYNWEVLNDVPEESGRAHIEAQIRSITDVPFEVIHHEAGVRPASADRRPVLGTHPEHNALHIFNGLGTKGMMLGPYFGNMLVQHLLRGQKILKEVDVKRFF